MSALMIDLGKTTCRGVCEATRREGVGAPGLATPGGVDAALDAILALGIPLSGKRVGVGAAGALASLDAAAGLADRLVSAGAVEAAVTSDLTAAHAGALGGGPGAVLIAGTGAACLAVNALGARRIDGWGPLLGDEGSGAWIGREGLRAALRAHDGRGPATDLLDLATTAYRTTADALPSSVTDARACGHFARHVAQAARDGDEVAGEIVERAAQALAETVRAALPDGGPLVVVGGLLHLGDMLWKPLRDSETVEWREPLGDAMDGARLLLDNHGTVHEAAVRRA